MQRYGFDLRSHRDPNPRAAGLAFVLTIGTDVIFTVRISAGLNGVPLPVDAQTAADAIAGFIHARAGIPAEYTPKANRGYDAGYLTGSESLYRADLDRRALELKRDAEKETE